MRTISAWLFWVCAVIVVVTLTTIVVGGITIMGALILGATR